MAFASKAIVAVGLGAALQLVSGFPSAAAGAQGAPATQNAYEAPMAAPVRLEVTGTAARLSIDAERSDVQSTLRAILKQAGKQFVPDATVTGQVTLLLTGQPIDTVLNAICDECYLKYTASPSGIYRFTRDDAAIKKAFTELNQLNDQHRRQLRSLGIDVPTNASLGSVVVRGRGAAADKDGLLEPQVGFGAGRGLNRGVAASRPAAAADGPINGPAGPAAGTPSGSAAAKRDVQNRIANIHTDFIPQGEISQFLKQSPRTNTLGQDPYALVLRQNGLVWFNIPEEKPEPVATVLQLFSQQANVPILVDQSIPNSLKFRVWGNLSPRQLPEALNILAPTAHLQWRWIGSTVFVVPAPNFTVYFGELGSARSAYPAAQRNEAGAGAETKDKKGGSD